MRTQVSLLIALMLAGFSPAERPADSSKGRDDSIVMQPSPAVAAVCDTVATLWRATGGASVRQADTTSVVASDSGAQQGCVVLANAPDGLDSMQRAGLYWATSLSRGWREITEYTADGPDGGSQTLERSGIRCQVDFSQDGGDDSDSTYVPSPAIGETTFCWERSG
jgi:hypothetical protein